MTAPLFFPAVVSTHGEFCEGMVSIAFYETLRFPDSFHNYILRFHRVYMISCRNGQGV